MVLDPDGCYRALRARDRRFDGVFFVGITSTGIYCRPVCPARPARIENCRWFGTAAAAERDGYRPCLRCRPECAPGNASVDAVERIASAALARIEAGALNGRGVDHLAAEFGVTARHLRRSMEREFGVTPVQAAQTQRLLLAKKLLTETALPVTGIAFASGFESVRRFNALFRSRYGLSPKQLRRHPIRPAGGDAVVCHLSYRPPFDWNALLDFLEPRSIRGIESVAGGAYRREVRIGGYQGTITVTDAGEPRHALRVELSLELVPVLAELLTRLKRLFDLNAHPDRIAARLGEDPLIAPLVLRSPGLRVPGAFDGFEMSLRAILGQQISVRAATTIAGRFADCFGALDASRIASSSRDDLCRLGLTGARAETVLALARAHAEARIRLEPGADPASAIERLQELPGIGPWTAHYIAMRALGWPDAFPHTDLGIYKALGTRSPSRVLEIGRAWSPWRAYAVMHLWRSLP